MADFLGSVWWMIVSLGVLVTFHEFGHFWVARRCGVKVLRFSVGFGRPLWTRRDRHGTEFVIALLPLGGYVRMLDEREGNVHPAERTHAFNNKPVLQRIAIVAAGPVANVILCLALLWAMLLIGRADYSATLGPAQGMAASAGLHAGDRITGVDGRTVQSASDASVALILAAMDRRDAHLDVLGPEGDERRVTLPLGQLAPGFAEQRVPELAGLSWSFQQRPAVIAEIAPGTPADGVLQPGDRILAVDGQAVTSGEQVEPLVAALGRRGGAGMVEVQRGEDRLALELAPRQDASAPGGWRIGVALAGGGAPAYDMRVQYGPLAAVPAAIREAGNMTANTLGVLKRLVTGHASLQVISGPVGIARAANDSAKRGVDWFLYFLATLSLGLAILNFLPIPILDGGHLLYYLIELVKGSPLSDRVMIAGQYVGLALLAGLMGLAFYNDILGPLPR
ncbi:RIP metalloprotease RseP [Stenotrophomonas sp. HITSZ_GD]|uniref:RIP metalloprotease RseP n=1 Tax=Stenotrophomonas sp. HITSZ_GD TaxID=3037248 RepID=UPI00240DBA5D|nr:RIP metalloprotease RseP [Stenotrophomonas sp. HITSZ_GD]MDG2526763.1 RIP metalloprotease RseP [Stenotrophomonas sp. HITSZ_GD]